MKSVKLGLGVAMLATAFAVMAQSATTTTTTNVSSGTGLPVTSGTGLPVTPGTGAVVVTPGITQGHLIRKETVTVTSANTAAMGAAPGSTVTVTEYAMPAPPANGYLAGDYARMRALGK